MWYDRFLIKQAMGSPYEEQMRQLSQQALRQTNRPARPVGKATMAGGGGQGLRNVGKWGMRIGLPAALGYGVYRGIKGLGNFFSGVEDRTNQTNQAIDAAVRGR